MSVKNNEEVIEYCKMVAFLESKRNGLNVKRVSEFTKQVIEKSKSLKWHPDSSVEDRIRLSNQVKEWLNIYKINS